MPRNYRSLPAKFKENDPKYDSPLVAKIINNVMRGGKKTISQRIVYDALELAGKTIKDVKPFDILNKAIDNCRPTIMTKSRRVGGATYQVPVEVPYHKGVSYAMKWIISIARKKKGKPMSVRLSNEIIQAYKGEGDAVKKKIDTHKMAESNRAFAHLSF